MSKEKKIVLRPYLALTEKQYELLQAKMQKLGFTRVAELVRYLVLKFITEEE